MNRKLLLLILTLIGVLAIAQGRSQAQVGPRAVPLTNGSPVTHAGLRYGGEVFWPFLETNLWDPTMWPEDLLPLFQEQHLSLGVWSVKWCEVLSQGDPADPDTWDWDPIDPVVRTFAGSGIEPFVPVTTGDCELVADTGIEGSSGYPPAEGR